MESFRRFPQRVLPSTPMEVSGCGAWRAVEDLFSLSSVFFSNVNQFLTGITCTRLSQV